MKYIIIVRGLLLIIYVIVCAAEDIKKRRISLLPSAAFAAAGASLSAAAGRGAVDILFALAPAAIVFAASAITKGCVGKGDAVLLAVCGLYLSAEITILTAAVSLGCCAVYSLFVIVIGFCTARHKDNREGLPFAAFMVIPAAAAGVMDIADRLPMP